MSAEIRNNRINTVQKQQAAPAKVKTNNEKNNSVFETSRQEQANAMVEDALGELLDKFN